MQVQQPQKSLGCSQSTALDDADFLRRTCASEDAFSGCHKMTQPHLIRVLNGELLNILRMTA
jgi:hypothetical protein